MYRSHVHFKYALFPKRKINPPLLHEEIYDYFLRFLLLNKKNQSDCYHMGFRQNMRRFDQKDNEKSMNEKFEHTHTHATLKTWKINIIVPFYCDFMCKIILIRRHINFVFCLVICAWVHFPNICKQISWLGYRRRKCKKIYVLIFWLLYLLFVLL